MYVYAHGLGLNILHIHSASCSLSSLPWPGFPLSSFGATLFTGMCIILNNAKYDFLPQNLLNIDIYTALYTVFYSLLLPRHVSCLALR